MDKINVSIGQDPNSKSLIGVLDIYGFESFKSNRYAVGWRSFNMMIIIDATLFIDIFSHYIMQQLRTILYQFHE